MSWKKVSWRNRAHFFAVSAKLMRHILVDFARRRPRLERGGEARQVSLDEALVVPGEASPDLVAIDDALETLATFDARKSQIVELRFFGGLSVEENGCGLESVTDHGDTRVEEGQGLACARARGQGAS